MTTYTFTFMTGPFGDRKRITWTRHGTNMFDVFELAKKAAKKDYPDASAFCITADHL